MTAPAGPLLRVTDLVVSYGHGRKQLQAVDGVSFEIGRGQTLGIIGESGSGKSTLALAVAGIVPVTAGRVEFLSGRQPRRGHGRGSQVQMVFQDPALALNPRLPVWKSIAEPMAPGAWRLPAGLRQKAEVLLSDVGLGRQYADSLPGQLSGGQKQRVTIARALAAEHPLVLCDEPVSALDSSLQVGVLSLLSELASQRDLSYLIISHDLTSVAVLADQVAVMYMGQFVEIGPTAAVLARPRHPYTRALVDAVPKIARRTAESDLNAAAADTTGDAVSDPRNPPSGCRFRLRCPYATDLCATSAPALTGDDETPEKDGGSGHRTACHYWPEIAQRARPPRPGHLAGLAPAEASRFTTLGDKRSPQPRGDA
ncbi:MAG TPA: ABC transporter ATP-binding protein [Trebonia sp.]|jgi:oligopeptide/dipeptide ABC transporter ATP-binding protein